MTNTDIALDTLRSLKVVSSHGASLEIVMSALAQACSNEREICAKQAERYGCSYIAGKIRSLTA